MVSIKLWLVVVASLAYCGRGNRLENEISKKKLNEHHLLELVSALRDQVATLQSDVSYIRRKTKQAYELLKKTYHMSSNWTANGATEKHNVGDADGKFDVTY